jgi:hypothetical protein
LTNGRFGGMTDDMNASTVASFPPDKIRALIGLTPAALNTLLAVATPAIREKRQQAQQSQPDRKRQVGGGRKRRLTTEQEILLTLVYLRHNVCHAVVGQLFGVSADTAENTFAEVVAVLREVCPSNGFAAKKRWKRSEPSWKPEEVDKIIVDSFETPVSRPSENAAQRRIYSGKKKRHTLKSQIVTDGTGEILEVSFGHRGPTSDKRLYEESGVAERYPDAVKQGDLGYQGIDGVEVPHKKPRGGELTGEQRESNRSFSGSRVVVEHGIRRVKAFRVVRDEFRLALGLFPLVASAVVGLVQLNRFSG